MAMIWEGMVLASQQPISSVETCTLSEYKSWLSSNHLRFPSSISLFLQYEFLSYYKHVSGKDVTVYKIEVNPNEISFIVFDKTVSSDGRVIITNSSFSPYAGLISTSKSEIGLIQAYKSLVEFIRNESKGGEDLTIEIRLAPPEIRPRVVIDQWALWSLGFRQSVGYLGRYLTPGKSKLNRNRERRLKSLKEDLKDWEIKTLFEVDLSTFDLMVKNRQSRHSATLTHSFSDFEFLSTLSDGKFIKCWKLLHENHFCAAAILFCDTDSNILQYLGQSECGYIVGTQDLLVSQIIEWSGVQDKTLLFGTSTKPEMFHRDLNFGLDSYKSSWGALAYTCYRYSMPI